MIVNTNMANNNIFAKSTIMLESPKIYRKLKCSNQMETTAVYLICLKKNPQAFVRYSYSKLDVCRYFLQEKTNKQMNRNNC